MVTKRTGWQTVREGVAHPDHVGVVGDLVKHLETGSYRLQEYNAVADQYIPYSVPYTWAKRVEAGEDVPPPAPEPPPEPPVTEPKTRQARWQQAQRALGRCPKCGGEKPEGQHYCNPCKQKHATYQRTRLGCATWKAGKPGRPPKETE
jgi:hypothetical protein